MFGSGRARRPTPMRCMASSHETSTKVSLALSYAIGWVRRPSSSSAWSCQFQSSLIVCLAKNSGVARFDVASQLTALAPFSQNSNDEVCFGSGHAQPGQSKPFGWFIRRMAEVSRTTAICLLMAPATARSAPQPPAGPSYSPTPGTFLSFMECHLVRCKTCRQCELLHMHTWYDMRGISFAQRMSAGSELLIFFVPCVSVASSNPA